jgi:hypothetical protein
MFFLFRRISISDSGISINLMNTSFQLKNTEINLKKLEQFISELCDFEYKYININNKKSIDVVNTALGKNKIIKWENINEDRLIEIVEEIIENIPSKGEVN